MYGAIKVDITGSNPADTMYCGVLGSVKFGPFNFYTFIHSSYALQILEYSSKTLLELPQKTPEALV